MAKTRQPRRPKPEDQRAIALRAFELKAGAPLPQRPETKSSHQGMKPHPNEAIAPEGALEAEGFRPALGRARAR